MRDRLWQQIGIRSNPDIQQNFSGKTLSSDDWGIARMHVVHVSAWTVLRGGGEAQLDVRPQQHACRLKVIEVLEDEMMSGCSHGCV